MSSELFRNLPTPEILDTRTFSEMLADIKADCDAVLAQQLALGRITEADIANFETAASTEGDPIWMVLQAGAYSKLKDAKATNETYLQVLMPFATGTNLDVLASNLGIDRNEDEGDDFFRNRACLQWALLEHGTYPYYQKLCLDADRTVKNARAVNPGPRAAQTLTNTLFSTDSPGGRHFTIIADPKTTAYAFGEDLIFKSYATQAEIDADTTQTPFFSVLEVSSETFVHFENIDAADISVIDTYLQVGDTLSIGDNRYAVIGISGSVLKIDDTATMDTNVDLVDGGTYTIGLHVRKKFLQWSAEAAGDSAKLAQIHIGDTLVLTHTSNPSDTKTYTVATGYDATRRRLRIDDTASVSDLTNNATYRVESPERTSANVILFVQSTDAKGGESSGSLLLKIFEYVTATTRKIQNDPVQVFSVEAVPYHLSATVEFNANENTAERLSELDTDVNAWAKTAELIGEGIYVSRLYQVLSPSYIKGVTIAAPTANLEVGDYQVPVLETLTLTEVTV